MMNLGMQLKPVAAMLAINFSLAVVNILQKKILNQGVSHLIIITYRQSISALFLAPIAYFWERTSRPVLTAKIVCHLFFSTLIGVTMTLYLFLVGLQYTSSTFACAFINIVPVYTFILALPFGLEKVNLKNKGGRGKVVGTLICVGGALVLVLYRGNPLTSLRSMNQVGLPSTPSIRTGSWTMGSILLTAACLLWSSWFLMQARITKIYPCQYTSTTFLSFFSAIQSATINLILDRDFSNWVLKGKLEIFSLLYAGIVGSGLCYVAMAWCVKQKGPVYTSAFTPFLQIFAAMFDFSVLHEKIYLGSVVGSILVIIGMYILLWGKDIDACTSKQAQLPVSQEAPLNNSLIQPITSGVD